MDRFVDLVVQRLCAQAMTAVSHNFRPSDILFSVFTPSSQGFGSAYSDTPSQEAIFCPE